ncbi:MAG: sodium-dependent transporter [Fibrobacterales bacterium]
MAEQNGRAVWGSKWGFIFAAVGSAVGLGNIWRFSYMAYENGGGAFLIPYIVAIIFAGIPLMVLEYAIGHKEQGASPLAFSRISKKLEWIGWWMPTVATIGIMLFYSVVIAWCLNYLVFSFSISWGGDAQSFFFNDFLGLPGKPFENGVFDLGSMNPAIIISNSIVWVLIWAICFKEINRGIEKACLVFMPLLFLLTTILVVWTVTLDGAAEGIKHYLTPDWDKIDIFNHYNDEKVWNVWIAAFGQIFFTLSLGFGIMITYASYLPRKADIVGNAITTTITNCLYSVFAGFAVFGVLGFMAQAKGVPITEVVKSGPSLAFVAYPEAISQLPFANSLFGIVFFLSLVLAGLSSGISLIEAFACSITDKFQLSRGKVITAICGSGFILSLIFTTNAGLFILDIVDHFINNYALVVGGLLECIAVGWVLKAYVARNYVNSVGGRRLIKSWDICIKYITPTILIIILYQAFKADFEITLGGSSIGEVLFIALLAQAITYYLVGDTETFKALSSRIGPVSSSAVKFIFRKITPVLFLILIVVSDKKMLYGGYPQSALQTFGVGILAFTLFIAIILAYRIWRQPRPNHTDKDEHLLT